MTNEQAVAAWLKGVIAMPAKAPLRAVPVFARKGVQRPKWVRTIQVPIN
jgi:hypothetical protein